MTLYATTKNTAFHTKNTLQFFLPPPAAAATVNASPTSIAWPRPPSILLYPMMPPSHLHSVAFQPPSKNSCPPPK